MSFSYRVDNIRKLQTLTKAYHANHKPYKELIKKVFDNVAASTEEEHKQLSDYATISTELEASILDLMENTVFIVPVEGGKFVLREHGQKDRFIKLADLPKSESVVKYKVEVVDSLKEATLFANKDEAETQKGAVNFALFRGYINGIGSNK